MGFIRILTMNRQDDAEEVFQNTCMILWQKFSQYDPSGDFAAWACRIAHYETLKHREAMGRIKILSDDALELVAEAALPISTKLSERRTALADCLEKLPKSQYAIIRQKYFDGATVEQIAETAGRSSHAIYRELSKAHGLLLRCVQRKITEVLT
ncbi:RNA polymerase sigma factor [Neorhodopirellula pilleata]|uniref:RNA polymerase sigma factor n=2 Tax=Neorhodopirellula pilleata TaxID=2714738 RepID=A0A5C6AR73_9BACT|nr:RNA polymerase sigma factor [Neorhodopirellula pilleata]